MDVLHGENVMPFVVGKYSNIFSKKKTSVLIIDVERIFWKKVSIFEYS